MNIDLQVAIIAGVAVALSAVATFLGAYWSSKFSAHREQKKEVADVRRRYLEPLRLRATDLQEHLQLLSDAFKEGVPVPSNRDFLKQALRAVETFDRGKESAFFAWCNGDGQFAIATLYRTAAYCWAADKIRDELQFVELHGADDRELLRMLALVRSSLGGEYGIWQSLQDSIGEYVKTADGGMLSYRDLCGRLFNPHEVVWLLRLVHFFANASSKEQMMVVKETIPALKDLTSTIDRASQAS